MKTTNRRNLILLVFSLAVVMLGFGMVIPVFPFLIQALGAGGSMMGILVATAALTELLFGPLWGSLSDQVGRKPVLMIGMFGYGLAMLLFGLATRAWMLIAFRALSGVLSSATLTTTMAYIGDSTAEKERGSGMGLLGATAGAGTIIGPGLGGLLAGGSLTTPFFVSAGLAWVALALVFFLLPESLPAEARAPRERESRSMRLDDVWSALKRALGRGLWRTLWNSLRSPIGSLLGLAFVATFGTSQFEAVFSLYMLQKLGYGPEQVGGILALVGMIALVSRGVLTGTLTRFFGEMTVIKASLLGGAAGLLLLVQADTYTNVLLTTGLLSFSITFLRPAIHSLVSKRATTGQGTALGLSNSFVSLGRVAGPLCAGVIFDFNPSYPYVLGAAILFGVFVIASVSTRQHRRTALQTEGSSHDKS